MSQAAPAPSQKLVTELRVSGHLMTLEKGLFCVFHAPDGPAADSQTGLPGVRITHPPLQDKSRMSISSFNEDGWIGAGASAALVRVNEGTAQLLVTIYQNGAGQHEAPKLQVMRLGDVPARETPAPDVPGREVPRPELAPSEAPAEPPPPPAAAEGMEVAAHVQRRGDRLGKLGEWMGEPGSQSWIEGFAISPSTMIGPEDIEYQAVLGKGWLSPWSEGGQYCGSRGMALPILGLRVRLKGQASETHTLRVSATFTDGSKVGPISGAETAEAGSLAPLEAFRIEILPERVGEAGFPVEPPMPLQETPVQETPAAQPVATQQTSAPKRIAARPTPAKAPVKAPVKATGKLLAGKPAPAKPGRPARR